MQEFTISVGPWLLMTREFRLQPPIDGRADIPIPALGRQDMDHAYRAFTFSLLDAIKAVWSLTFAYVSCPVFFDYLASIVIRVLFKYLWADSPAVGTAYASISIYLDLDHANPPIESVWRCHRARHLR
jgi:hypothetical protein